MIRASAPASSANLGPGFDCLGLALTLRNDLKISRGRGAVHVRGEGEKVLARDGHNFVARNVTRAAGGAVDLMRDRLDIHCINRVPLARGLGSSTAAAAIGILSGWMLAGEHWTADRLFDELVQVDGHPDNAAACAYGGIVLAQTRADGIVQPTLIETPLPVCFIAVVPAHELETSEARAALPDSYDRATTVKAIGAAGLLVLGLERGDPDLLGEALHADVIHEPQRAGLVPELGAVREAISSTPALGATISGAGPSILVWCTKDSRAHVRETMLNRLRNMRLLDLDLSEEPATVWRGR